MRQGMETELSLDLQLALIEKQAKELWRRKALEQEARAAKAELELSETREALDLIGASARYYLRGRYDNK